MMVRRWRPVRLFVALAVLGLPLLAPVLAPTSAAAAPNPPKVFVANANANTVTPFPVGATQAQILPAINVGRAPVSVAVSPDGNTAYVVNDGANSVSVIDVAIGAVTTTVPVGSAPFGIAVTPDGAYAYVTNLRGNSVSVIATATNTVTATVPVGRFPEGIAISPNGATAYAVNDGDNNVSVIDIATNTVTGTIPVGQIPGPIAISPNGAVAYVGNNIATATGGISVIDLSTNTVVQTVQTANQPFGIAFTPNGATAYVANFVGGSVSVIDVATRTVTATISGGGIRTPTAVAVTPDGSTVYMVDFNAAATFAISTSTNTVTQTLTGFGGPEGIAITPADTTTSLGVSPTSPAVAGTQETLTATITPTTAVGTVQFFSDSVALPGGPVTVTNGTATLNTTLPVGGHTVTASFTPGGGNFFVRSGASPVSYDVVNPAVVTINQAAGQPDPAATAPINFTVTFSTPVTGFTAGDVTLGGTAPGTKTAVVTPTGPTTYNVAVSGMTGAGTVTASIPANVVNEGNTASTSTDNSVLFQNGDTTAPACAVVAVRRPPGTASGHSEMDVRATDTQSGLASITNIAITNGVASITPSTPFAPGTTQATLTAIKSNESLQTTFSFTVTDRAGNSRRCS